MMYIEAQLQRKTLFQFCIMIVTQQMPNHCQIFVQNVTFGKTKEPY